MISEAQKAKGYAECLKALPKANWQWLVLDFKDYPLLSHVKSGAWWQCPTPFGDVTCTFEDKKWVFVVKNESMSWGVLSASQLHKKVVKAADDLQHMLYSL